MTQDTLRSVFSGGLSGSCCFPVDNHDIISLKLFELTVARTPEEEKLHRDVFLPSVDNMKLPESEHRDPGDPGNWPTVGEGQPCGGSDVTCAHGAQGHLLSVLP